MPRKARPSTPPLPTTSPGQSYGVAGEQKAALQAVPMPDAAPIPGGVPGAPSLAGPPSAPAGAAPAPAGGGAAPAGEDPLGAAIMAALVGPSPVEGGLTRPTERPDEDLLTMPPVMRPARVTPTARVLAMLAEANGNDPALRSIADDAAMKGY